ncbi:hypothetical protein DL768_001461 [Monosporascus sp. mg162]|nr:hypothetical protein DL768_001461 [Monosporascus sp. mg162]
MILGNQYRMVENSVLSAAVSVMRRCFRGLLEGGHYHRAHKVAWNVQLARKVGGGFDLLEELLRLPSTPELVRACVIRDLVLAQASLELEDLASLEKTARAIFDSHGHKTGCLELDLHHVGKNLRGSNGSETAWQEWSSCFNRLTELDNAGKGQKALADAFECTSTHVFLPGASPRSFDRHQNIRAYIDRLLQREDEKLHWVSNTIATMMIWMRQTAHTSKLLETGIAVYEELRSSDCEWVRGFVAQSLSYCNAQLKKKDDAVEWATVCYNHWKHLDLVDKARARKSLLFARLSTDSLSKHEVAELERVTWHQIQEEAASELWTEAIEKAELVVKLFPTFNPDIDYQRWWVFLGQSSSNLPDSEKAYKQANLKQMQGIRCIQDFGLRQDIVKENEAIQHLSEAIKIYEAEGRYFESAALVELLAHAQYSIYLKLPTIQHLSAAIERYASAQNYFWKIDQMDGVARCSLELLRRAYAGWTRGWIQTDEMLRVMGNAETANDRIRDNMSIQGGLSAVLEKQRLRQDDQIQLTYVIAIELCVVEKAIDILWEWIQRSKARSVSDMMGLGILIPRDLMREMESEKRDGVAAVELYKEEQRQITQLRAKPPHMRLILRGELWKLHEDMSNFKSLRRLLYLRRGDSVQLEQLRQLTIVMLENKRNGCAVYVDWFLREDDFHMVILPHGQAPILRPCSITRSEVVAWKAQFFDSSDGIRLCLKSDDTEDNPFRQLDRLVKPLQGLLPSDSLLVLSPTDVLHSIPLHALWLNNVPLIEDYPVIYCASVTTFVQSFGRATGVDESGPTPGQKALIAVYEPSQGLDFHCFEQAAIYDSVDRLQSLIGGSVYKGANANREAFTKALESSSVVQFHGHCTIDSASVLDRSLVLGDGAFSARGLFGVQIQTRLVTLMACGSALQAISQGDEPLGMVTALLCAGAPSVVGTLWPVASGTGREFAEAFYRGIGDSLEGGLANLAVAVQEAVIRLKYEYEYRHPYHWAGFVLHGSPYCKAEMWQG